MWEFSATSWWCDDDEQMETVRIFRIGKCVRKKFCSNFDLFTLLIAVGVCCKKGSLGWAMSEKKQAELNIQTFLRIKPSKSPSGYFSTDELDHETFHVQLPENFKSEYIDNSKLHHKFHFNGIVSNEFLKWPFFHRWHADTSNGHSGRSFPKGWVCGGSQCFGWLQLNHICLRTNRIRCLNDSWTIIWPFKYRLFACAGKTFTLTGGPEKYSDRGALLKSELPFSVHWFKWN